MLADHFFSSTRELESLSLAERRMGLGPASFAIVFRDIFAELLKLLPCKLFEAALHEHPGINRRRDQSFRSRMRSHYSAFVYARCNCFGDEFATLVPSIHFAELAYSPSRIDVAATGAPRSVLTLGVGHLGARTRESQGSFKLETINSGE